MIPTCLSNTKIFCRHHSPSCLGSLASLLLMAGEVWCLPSIGAISPASLSECRQLVSAPGLATWEREQGRWLAGEGTSWSRSCGLEGRQKPISWLMWGEGGGGEVRHHFDLILLFPSPMNKYKLMPWKRFQDYNLIPLFIMALNFMEKKEKLTICPCAVCTASEYLVCTSL